MGYSGVLSFYLHQPACPEHPAMDEPGQTRKLAAILAADVAGYSRLMGDDEKATVQTLFEYRQVFSEHIRRHQGRLVDTAGDSVLSTFESPVEAVECAVEIQRELARRNRNLADHRKMHFRIGINLGDVITREDGTVYGDGVNIAARLQALAEPGGLTISGTIHDHIKGRVEAGFEFTGEHAVKNIAEPVRAYRVVFPGGLTGTTPQDASTFQKRKRIYIAMAAVLSLSVVLLAALRLLQGEPPASSPTRRALLPISGLGDVVFDTQSPMALTGDGSVIVYSAVRGSTDLIQARRLDGLDAQPIQGTAGGHAPFISYDNQMLGFERDGELFVVPMAGGAATQIKGVTVSAEGRPTWTPDGRIVFTNEKGALVLVRAENSSAEVLTVPTKGSRHISPSMLPDGRTLLYTDVGADINGARLMALGIADRQSRPLVTDGALTPQYADGYLFYCRSDRALMAAPFDAKRAALTGEPVMLPDRIDRTRFGVAHYAVGRGALLYKPFSRTRLIERGSDGSSNVLTETGNWHKPVYSPDGKRIAFDRVTDGTNRDVWVYDRTDKIMSRVTHIGDAHDPMWLPNGKEIAFLSFKSVSGPLIIDPVDGGRESHAVPISGPFRSSDLVNPGGWLPDGTGYLGGVREKGSTGDIWLIPLGGGTPTKLVGLIFDEHSPSVSADGHWLAYQSDETGRAEVYVQPLMSNEGRIQVSTRSGKAPVWSKKGTRLFYLEPENEHLQLMAATLRVSPSLSVIARKVVLPDVRLEEADNHPNYDVDLSGTHFVMPDRESTQGLAVVFDWTTFLSQKTSRSKH